MSNKSILKTEDIITAINVCSNILIDTLKSMSYIMFLGKSYLCPGIEYLEYLYFFVKGYSYSTEFFT